MAAWWDMMCDDNHRWEVFVAGDDEPASDCLNCARDGLPVVTATRHPLAERAVIQLVPLTSEREGIVGHEDEFVLEIYSSTDATERFRSGRLTWTRPSDTSSGPRYSVGSGGTQVEAGAPARRCRFPKSSGERMGVGVEGRTVA